MANTAGAGKPKSVSGAVFVAPAGTSLPTDASTALNAAFKSVGYITEDGITNTQNISTEEKKSWGGLVIMSSITEKTDEFKFTMASPKNEEALKLVYGSTNVTVASGGAITVNVNAKEPEEKIIAIEMIVAGVATRIVIPKAKLKGLGDINYKDTEAVGYEVTMSALADSNDNTHYEYTA